MAKKKLSSQAKKKGANVRVLKKIKPASKLPKRWRGLIYGRSGAGKTRLAATLPKVLVIDVNEQGTDSTRSDLDPNVYPLEYWDELNDVFWFLQSGEHEYESVAIDGVTGMQTLCMKFVLGDEAARDASRDPDMPSRQVWGKVGELMKTQITNFRNLPLNVLFTALQRVKITGDDEDEEGEVFISPQCSPSISTHLEAAVGMIGFLHTSQILGPKIKGKKKRARVTRTRLLIGPSDRYLTKDRYGLMVPHIDMPNLTEVMALAYGKGGKRG